MKNNYSKEDLAQVGIYAIVHIGSGRVYIGSTSLSFRKRRNQHKYELSNAIHKNTSLQANWDEQGESAFEFKILEAIPKDEIADKRYLRDIEQAYLDATQFPCNICPTTTSCLSRKCSDETRRKMSKTRRGTKPSEDNRQAVIAANSKKYTFTTTHGVEISFHNLRAFCRENDLTQSAMVRVSKSKQAYHKGWTCQSAIS